MEDIEPNRVPWTPDFLVGDAIIDDHHRQALERCNRLADYCAAGAENDQAFEQEFVALMRFAREHFAAEAAALESAGHVDLEEFRQECADFEYVSDDIATMENFDKTELQRYLSLWWMGHIIESARRLQPPQA